MSELDESIMAGGNNLMYTMNPLMLIGGFAIIALIAWVSARAYRNTNDFRKSVKLYAVLAVAGIVIYYLAGMPAVLIVSYLVCGFVFTALFSNHYFYS